jgi:lipoprotein-releasing system permease protein
LYAALLTRRYLTRRIMPLLSSIAVMLCTAMIIIVWSVMTGWLGQVTNAGRTFLGDVSILPPSQGLPNYDALCAELEALPEVAAAAPQLDTFGLLHLPGDQTEPVQVVGIDPQSYNAVAGYFQSLYWVAPEPPLDEATREIIDEIMHLLRHRVRRAMVESLAVALAAGEPIDLEQVDQAWDEVVLEPIRQAIDLYDEALERLAGRPAPEHDDLSVRQHLRERQQRARRALRLARDVGADNDWRPARLERLAAVVTDAQPDDRLRLSSEPGEHGRTLAVGAGDERRPGMVLGIEVSRFSRLLRDGSYEPRWGDGLLGDDVTLSLAPIDDEGGILQPEQRKVLVANEFRTGLYEADSNRVFVPLEFLQELMHWDEAVRVEPGSGGMVFDEEIGEFVQQPPKVIEEIPARVNAVLVKGVEGIAAEDLRVVVEQAYGRFAAAHEDMPVFRVRVLTWREQVSTLISAIETQRALMLTMFIFISFTAIFLVFAIFWSIVSEKVKDIGTLRALGASRPGVAWIFLRYGLIVGVIGAIGGGVLATIFVANINELHELVGRLTGLYVWRAEVYQFATIPGKVDPVEAIFVMIGGVMFSIVGSLAPAIKAANLDPVEALQFE